MIFTIASSWWLEVTSCEVLSHICMSYLYLCFCEHLPAPQFLCKSRDKELMKFSGTHSNILEEVAYKTVQSLHCDVIQSCAEVKNMKMFSEKAKDLSRLSS